MFRPAPSPFPGSMPEEEMRADGLTATLTGCFGAVAVLAALGVWLGAYVLDSRSDPFEVMKLSCCALLAPSLLGGWLTRKVAREPGRLVGDLYTIVQDQLAQPGPFAVPQPARDGIAGVAGLIVDLVRRTRRLGRTEQLANAMRQTIFTGRAQSASVAVELRQEAAALTEAAMQIDATGACIVREMAANADSLALGDMALRRAADAIDALTGRVNKNMAAMEEVTRTAVRLADIAHATHKAVAEHDVRSTHLSTALDQIGQAMHTASRLLDEAARRDAAETGGAAESSLLTHEMQVAAGRFQPALAAAQAVVHDLVSETSAANRRALETGEMVANLHARGQAVGHAVQQQAEDVSVILTYLYEARSGFAMLRDSVDAVAHAGATRANAAARMREAALRLPSQAERMAEILRGIPDFRPSEDI